MLSGESSIGGARNLESAESRAEIIRPRYSPPGRSRTRGKGMSDAWPAKTGFAVISTRVRSGETRAATRNPGSPGASEWIPSSAVVFTSGIARTVFTRVGVLIKFALPAVTPALSPLGAKLSGASVVEARNGFGTGGIVASSFLEPASNVTRIGFGAAKLTVYT